MELRSSEGEASAGTLISSVAPEKYPRVVENGRNAKFMLTNSLWYNSVIEHSQRDDIYLGDIFIVCVVAMGNTQIMLSQ